MKFQRPFLLLSFLFTCLSPSFSQYYKVDMADKLANTSSIIEGVVTNQEAFYIGSDIYTKNYIEVLETLKGAQIEDNIIILTYGGTIDDITMSVSEGFSLHNRDKGYFFLMESEKSTNTQIYYEVFSGRQGFYQKKNNNYGDEIIGFLSKYEGFNSFKKAIGIAYDISKIDDEKFYTDSSDYCLNYRLEPITIGDLSNSTQVGYKLYVSANKDVQLQELGLSIAYSLDWFGDNIVQNGKIQVLEGDFLSYSLNTIDVSQNIVQFTLTSNSSLRQLSSDETLLCTFYVTVENFADVSPVQLENSLFYANLLDENNNQVVSRCGKITPENPRGDCNPLIESFNIRDGAGAEKILTIHGKRLIHPDADGTKCNVPSTGKYLDHRVKFTDVNGNWVAPLFGDYISWTDTKIVVKIPTFGFVGDGNIKTQFKLDEYAATGKIQVCIHSTDKKLCDCNDISGGKDDEGNETQEELYVPFSTFSGDDIEFVNSNSCIETFHARLISLFTDKTTYFNISALPVDYQNAFIRALNKWRCRIKINFAISSNEDGIPVEFANNLSGKLGVTSFEIQACNTLPNEQNIYKVTRITFDKLRFDLGLFNPDIEPTPPFQYDFERTAMHEIGHAIGLIHTNNEYNLMFPTQDFGATTRLITGDDEEGGVYCQAEGQKDISGCGLELIELSGNCQLGFITSTRKINSSNEILIFPNPTAGSIAIDVRNMNIGVHQIEIEVYNSIGKLVVHKKMKNLVSSFSLSEEKSGVYFLKIKYADLMKIVKVIKL